MAATWTSSAQNRGSSVGAFSHREPGATNPVSLSAGPSNDYLRLTVKAVRATTSAVQRLRPGTRVLAEGPYGAMPDRRRRGNGVLVVAGGVGITPMRALFETMPVEGGRLTLLYRASASEEILFRDELETIAAERGADLAHVVGSSSDPATAITANRLRSTVGQIAERDVSICASPRFSEAMRTALHDAGVPKQRVHHGKFAF